MRFDTLVIHNFKSYSGKHVFPFRGRKAGLWFITGQNKAEPELGANGVGKSSLWDAVFWVLFGKTLNGLRASDLRPWALSKRRKSTRRGSTEEDSRGSKGVGRAKDDRNTGPTWGSLRLSIGGETVRIRRSWKPNSLTVRKGENSQEIVSQEQITELIGIDEDSFKQSVIIGQKAQMFFDLRPSEKLVMFSELMSLDYWTEKSKAAGGKHRELTEQFHELDSIVVKTRTLKKSAEETLEEDRAQLSVLKKECKKELRDNRAKRTAVIVDRDNLKKKIAEEKARLEKLKSKSSPTAEQSRSLEREVGRWQENVDTIRSNILEIKGERERKEEHLDQHSKNKKRCPACGQKVGLSHFKSERISLRKRIKVLVKEEKEQRALLEEAQTALNASRDELSKIQRKESIRLGPVEQARENLRRMRSELSSTRELIAAYKDKERGLSLPIKRQEERITNLEEKLEKFNVRFRKAKKALRQCETLMQGVAYWVPGFKDIRLSIVEETLAALTVEVNNFLPALGMEDWSMSFSVERETKSGNISRGFQILVQSPTSPPGSLVSIESWSGGEGQRLRLAATMGLSNLILDQRGIDTNIQVWDEPLYGLSGTGRDGFLSLLQQVAVEQRKQIYVVEHRALEFGFDGVVTINKDERGSHILS